MHFRFSADEIHNFLPALSQQVEATLDSDEFESILTLPSHLGKGLMYRFEPRPGLELRVQNATFLEPIKFEVQSAAQASLSFHFCLSGHIQRTFQRQSGFNLKAGESSLSFASTLVGTGECQPRQNITYIEIDLAMVTLNQLIHHQLESLPRALRPLFKGNSQGIYFHSGVMTYAMRQIAEQILNCPYQGLTRSLYLESKVIELIALRLDDSFGTQSKNRRVRLRSNDIACIQHAKQILLSDLEHPPSLLELAQRVGLNDHKLKQGFHQVFGTTVFGYLYDYRMQQAYQLLTIGELNITEVALRVGYSSLSSFNRAFKKKFGMTPSQVMRS